MRYPYRGNATYNAKPLSERRQASLILQPWLTAGDGMPSSRVTSDRAVQMRESLSDIVADTWVSTDQVMGILGHELRNPLSAIAALARVTMAREDLPGDVRERLAQMDRAAQRSLAMIESMLDFTET